MSKHVVKIICWKRSHVNELVMNKAQEKKLADAIPVLKKVCPDCKPENCHITIVNGTTVFHPAKAYRCERGHLSLVSLLGDGIHVCFGPGADEFVNLLDKENLVCHHIECGAKLIAIDDFKLSPPSVAAIKTKTRVGDVWDRKRIEPVRSGTYDARGDYHESRTQKANRSRLARMSRQRNISKDRLPGDVIRQPTKDDYGYRNKDSLNE